MSILNLVNKFVFNLSCQVRDLVLLYFRNKDIMCRMIDMCQDIVHPEWLKKDKQTKLFYVTIYRYSSDSSAEPS